MACVTHDVADDPARRLDTLEKRHMRDPLADAAALGVLGKAGGISNRRLSAVAAAGRSRTWSTGSSDLPPPLARRCSQ